MRKFLLPLLVLFIGFTSCSDNESEPETEVKGEVSSYKGIELKLVDSENEEYGIAFSAKTGKTYKKDEISKDNIADIDLVSFTMQAFIAFNSPKADDNTMGFEGVKSTKIQMTNVAMTTDEFDKIRDDAKLKDLKIVDDNEAIKIDYRGVILFETAEGKKGALKVNALNKNRISFDVVVMK